MDSKCALAEAWARRARVGECRRHSDRLGCPQGRSPRRGESPTEGTVEHGGARRGECYRNVSASLPCTIDLETHDSIYVVDLHRTSSLTANNWRQQTISVDSIPLYNRNIIPTPLSRQAVPTGISQPPASPIDGTSGLVFHPFRMLYAAGGADGIVRLYGAKTEGVRPHKGII